MFAVPEVDDDIDASFSSVENTKSSTQPEVTTESLPSSPPISSSTLISTTEKEEKTPIKTQVPPPPPPPASRQHLSRLGLFQRNTIHVCDQIPDYM